MFNLLIVDDEPLILEGLSVLISENNIWPLDIFRACNGIDALEILNNNRIDIVITDIHMPGMSGIDLMNKIKLIWPLCKIIILTAHEVFDYAYTAIKSKGVRFLVKAEDYTVILDHINECVDEIKFELHTNEIAGHSKEQLLLIENFKKKSYLSDVLRGYEKASAQKFDLLKIKFNPNQPIFLILVTSNISDTSVNELSQNIVYLLPSVLDRHTLGGAVCEFIEYYYGITCFVVQFDCSESLVLPLLMSALEDAQGISGMKNSFVISSQPCSWQSADVEYKRLKAAFTWESEKECYIYALAPVESSGKHLAESDNKTADNCRKNIKSLKTHLNTGTLNAFSDLLDITLSQIREFSKNNPVIGRELIIEFNLFFITCINRLPQSVNAELKKIDPDSLYLLPQYLEYAKAVYDIKDRKKQSVTHSSISRLQTYIDSHLKDDISLNRLAGITHFNSKYLSKLFSDETGVNLSDYIADKRCREAKRLIEEGNMKIQDISEAVGFYSPAYFTRFFKKATGMSPSQYKDSIATR